jgi:hypothetical protein
MNLKDYTRTETGKITSISVLPATPEGSHFEINLSTQGEMGGVKFVTHWTYRQIQRVDGTIYGYGDGVLQTECGEIINMKGSGSSRGVNPDGSISMRVINHHHTRSEKFSFLNGTAAAGNYDVDSDGNATALLHILE